MQIVKINKKNQKQVIDLAVNLLKEGKTIIYPTETFYGLGCDAANPLAVRKIYLIKERVGGKALPFLVSSIAMAKDYLVFSPLAARLAKKYWPGPLSLVLPATPLGKHLLGRDDGGTRISPNPIATAMVEALGKPIISTSANLTGKTAASDIRAIINYFLDKKYQPDLIIDAGRLPPSRGSTFLSLLGDKPVILREGDIKIKIQGYKIQ